MAFIYDVHAHVKKTERILLKYRKKKKTWKNKWKKIIKMVVKNDKYEYMTLL